MEGVDACGCEFSFLGILVWKPTCFGIVRIRRRLMWALARPVILPAGCCRPMELRGSLLPFSKGAFFFFGVGNPPPGPSCCLARSSAPWRRREVLAGWNGIAVGGFRKRERARQGEAADFLWREIVRPDVHPDGGGGAGGGRWRWAVGWRRARRHCWRVGRVLRGGFARMRIGVETCGRRVTEDEAVRPVPCACRVDWRLRMCAVGGRWNVKLIQDGFLRVRILGKDSVELRALRERSTGSYVNWRRDGRAENRPRHGEEMRPWRRGRCAFRETPLPYFYRRDRRHAPDSDAPAIVLKT